MRYKYGDVTLLYFSRPRRNTSTPIDIVAHSAGRSKEKSGSEFEEVLSTQ